MRKVDAFGMKVPVVLAHAGAGEADVRAVTGGKPIAPGTVQSAVTMTMTRCGSVGLSDCNHWTRHLLQLAFNSYKDTADD